LGLASKLLEAVTQENRLSFPPGGLSPLASSYRFLSKMVKSLGKIPKQPKTAVTIELFGKGQVAATLQFF